MIGTAVTSALAATTSLLTVWIVNGASVFGWEARVVDLAASDGSSATGDVEFLAEGGGTGLVLPGLGLPAVWLERGDLVLFALWSVFVAGVAGVLVWLIMKRAQLIAARPVAGHAVDAAIRRLRGAVALVVVAYVVLDREAFAATPLGPIVLVSAVVVALVAVNVLSMVGADSRARQVVEVWVDGIVVALLAAPSASGSLLGVLLVLPVAEAAVRFGLTGAAGAWVGVSSGTIILGALLPGEPDWVQTSVLVFSVVPAAFIAKGLLLVLADRREAELSAAQRGELLHVVAAAGQRVSTVDLELMSTVIETTESLGFDRIDIVVKTDDAWTVVGGSGGDRSLPSPSIAAGGVLGHRLPPRLELDDADVPIAADLAALDLSKVIVSRLSVAPLAALRVGVAADRVASAEQIEALDLLVGQARVALRNELLVAELRSTRSALEEQALTDSLTGLPNRAAFHRHLAERRDREVDGFIGVLFCDLDGFKAVNDEMGHDAGDELLVEVARRLTQTSLAGDLVARIGGDEFVLVATRPEPRDLEILADRLVRTVGVPVPIRARTALVGSSVGVAVATPDLDDDELVRRADAAMYAVKSSGKHGWRRFDESLEAEPRRSLQLRIDVLAAMRRSEFELEYQPVVVSGTRPHRIVLAEALLRWRHPELGRIGPLETLAVADEAGIRNVVEEWVIRQACADAARWQRPGLPRIPVTVNLSPVQLQRSDLVQLIVTSLAGTGLPPECLVLELSEDAAIERLDVMASLEELRDRGVSLALDDFGTGEASLTTLRTVELDILKLDKSFVDRCDTVEAERMILGAISQLARGLGLLVISEGVERETQLDIVHDEGVDMVQGHVAFRPLPVTQFVAALEAQRRREADPSTHPGGSGWMATTG
ncbi:MAG: EAL domain-containing protein [Actinomycetota bacterium]